MMLSSLHAIADMHRALAQPVMADFTLSRFTAVHAIRVALAYRQRMKVSQRKTGRRPALLAGIFGYLAWGGSIVCACLLGLKPVQFLSPDPILAYSAIYLAVMVAFAILPSLESLVPYLDLPFLAVDALTRSKAIASTVQLAQRDMDYSTSSFAQTLLGMVSATAGSQIVSTFSMDEDEWRLRTPPFLKTINLVDSLDLWSAALGAYIFGAFNAVRPSHARLYRKGMGDGLSMLATPDGAQAGVAGVLLACYTWRYAWRSFHSSRLVGWARARTETETGQTVDQREVQALRDARKKGQ